MGGVVLLCVCRPKEAVGYVSIEETTHEPPT
jgi:hypothetical protein